MRKIVSVALAAAMSFGACNVLLAACGDDEKDAPYFDKETVFHVDLSMSTAIGPLGTLCEPGTITFRTDGTATFDVPFTDAALVMMDNLLGFRIPTFKHEDTYELNEDETAIIYHSTRKDFEEPQTLELETLSDGTQLFPWATLPKLYADGTLNGISAGGAANADPTMMTVVSALALITNIAALAYIIYVSVKRKKNPYKNEVFTEFNYYKKAAARAEMK